MTSLASLFRDRGTAAIVLALGALLLSTAGCAAAPESYGSRARFSPAYAGYVMAPDSGSDDPAEGDTVLLLRDPLTGQKLRCREDVVAWRELHEDLAVDLAEDENAAVAAGITTGALFGPLIVLEPVGALLLAEAMMTAGALYEDLRSAQAPELLAAGITLHGRKRYRHAAALLERALAKDPSVGISDKAYLYLGLTYAELGNEERASLALTMFVERASVRDVDAYREAERVLRRIGPPEERCASREPVELHW